MEKKKLMPLTMCRTGRKLRLKEIQGGEAINTRLISMGLVPGVEFSLISCDRKGPILVEVKDTRIALGRGLGMKIFVEEV